MRDGKRRKAKACKAKRKREEGNIYWAHGMCKASCTLDLSVLNLVRVNFHHIDEETPYRRGKGKQSDLTPGYAAGVFKLQVTVCMK